MNFMILLVQHTRSLLRISPLCLLIFVCSSMASTAQTTTTTTTTNSASNTDGSESSSGSLGMEIGFRYMPTFTAFEVVSKSNSSVQTTFTVGHGVGALLAWNMSNTTAVQVEMIYGSLSQKYVDNDAENTISLSYLNIPLLLSLNSDKSAALNFNAVIGPQIGINLGSSISSSGNGNGTSTVTGVIAVKAADLGFAYGFGLDFGSSPLRFNAGFRGVYGLLDISDKNTSTTTDQYYILNRSHVKTYAGYLGVSYMF